MLLDGWDLSAQHQEVPVLGEDRGQAILRRASLEEERSIAVCFCFSGTFCSNQVAFR